MKVVFCHMGAENLGLEYLSAVLKKRGHKVHLVFDPAFFNDKYYLNIPFLARIFDRRKRLLKEIKALKPDIIGFTVITDTYKWASSFARDIKRMLPSTPIIFGGIHPTSVPERVIANPYVDAICVGDGEEALPEYVEHPSRTDIQNIWTKKDGKVFRNSLRPLITDLDTLPYADKTIFDKYISIKDAYVIAGNRGCPFSCSYCCNGFLQRLYKGQKTLRQRSVRHIIGELIDGKKKYYMRSVYFVDDIFPYQKEFLEELLKEYKAHINLPFKIISHPAVLTDYNVKAYKDAGCFNIEIGIQSMCEETRRNVLKRFESDATIRKAIGLLEKYKLHYTLHHILGLPGDDYAKLRYAASFYCNLKSCTKIDCYWLAYFPKTEIVGIARDLKLISEEQINRIDNAGEPFYYDGGSVKDKNLRRLCKDFDIFFQLMPMLPKRLNRYILKNRTFRYFHLLPGITIYTANLLNAVMVGDRRTFDYIRYYFRHMFS